MPTLSSFYGISILMYYKEHPPPHFHAEYAEHVALIDIETLEPIKGKLPKRAMRLVKEWAKAHQGELSENWKLCADNQPVKKIDPLP